MTDYDSEGTYIGWMPKDENGDPYCPGCKGAPENCVCCPYCGHANCDDVYCDESEEGR